ncbi:putative reverse transcriptase domain-containing protein, partial [Tanacetum coccineum]
IMPPKSAPLTQAGVRRMIKESVDAAIAAERARHCNPTFSRDTERAVKLQRWFEKTEMTFGISECVEDKKVMFAAATLRRPALTWWNSKVAILGLDVANQIAWTEMKKLMTGEFCPAKELQRMENELWNLKVKEYNMVAYTQVLLSLALMYPRMVEPESVKVDAYIRGFSDNIKGEVTSSKPTNLNEAVRMAHKLMEQKFSGKSNNKDNSRQSSQSNQKQGNAQAMTTAPNEGKVSSGSHPVCEHCFTRHDGQCTIKCHKCRKVAHKARYCKEKNVATGFKHSAVWTCYDWCMMPLSFCGEKVVRILTETRRLTIEGDKGMSRLKKPKEKRLEDVSVIRNFPEVFPDDLPRLPPPRQVEFRIDLVPGATHVARAPYHLAPSKTR